MSTNGRHELKVKKRGVSARDRKIIKKRGEGKTIRQIASEVGVSSANVFLILKRLEPELQEALRLANYGLDKAITKMVEMTEAKKVEYFASNGIVTDSRKVADNATRFAARREMLRIHGVGNTLSVEHSGTITHELTQKERQEAKETLEKIKAYEKAYDVESGHPLLAEVVGKDSVN